MSIDLTDMSDGAFDDWLRNIDNDASEDALSAERLVSLVGITLRETTPQARAHALVDLANLCYAMADKTLGARAPADKFLKIVVTVGQRQ